MAITLAQLQAIINQAKADSGGAFTAFDDAYYAANNVAALQAYYAQPGNAGKSLLQHYVEAGAALNLKPSPYFDPNFYAQRWPDLNTGFDNTDLFAHWVKFGMSEGRSAVAALNTFNGARYLAENPDVAAYVTAHVADFLGSMSNGALAHYVKFGATEQRVAYDLAGATIALDINNFPPSAPMTFVNGTLDVDTNGGVTTLTGSAIAADVTGNGGVLRVTGDANLRIDLTNSGNAVRGIDLNGKNGIETNGVENNVAGAGILTSKGVTIVDAYPRNPLNTNDRNSNYTGSIAFDGTGIAADGTTTNGTIFLGGLGADTAFGGDGNDFLAGGGNNKADTLSGGRNADFFFVELSTLDGADGQVKIDGGETADNTIAGPNNPPSAVNAAGGLGTQDNDWILLEASDDNEPVFVQLTENTGAGGGAQGAGNIQTRDGSVLGRSSDVESLNASGNLYGFLNNIAVEIGGRAIDSRVPDPVKGTTNFGIGSTAQLNVSGSAANNIVVGGYDNDKIEGNAGNDLLFGGDLQFLIANKNNPNILNDKGGLNLTANSVGVVFDGRDTLNGGDGSDTIVFEADGGVVTGAGDAGKISGRLVNDASGKALGEYNNAVPPVLVTAQPVDDRNYDGPRSQSQGDNLYLTDFSSGRLNGATSAGEATASADALAKSTTDSVVRFDLGNNNSAAGAVVNFKNYGGANVATQDQTNYVAGVARTVVTGIESINATGLGTIDYAAAGSNPAADQKFANIQNYKGLQANLDLRGSDVDNVLLANNGNDTLEGRTGDDIMSGGAGKDTFVVIKGDGVDWVARPTDANGDSIWDTTGGLTVQNGLAWQQDFRAPQTATAGTQTLIVDFGSTVLDGKDTFVATFQIVIDGKVFGAAIPAGTLAAAKSTNEVAAIVNAAYQAIDKNVSVVATSATTIEVRAIDATPADGVLPVISTTPDKGFFVAGQASGSGSYQAKGSLAGQAGTNLEDDRLVIKTYDGGNGRAVNLGIDQTKLQTTQATDFVAQFSTTGTQLAEGQKVNLYLENIIEGDTVTVTVNGAKYSYTAVAADGNNTENIATKLQGVIAAALDINSASGQIAGLAVADSFGDGGDVGTNATTAKAGLQITQTPLNQSLTFMNVTAEVTRADGSKAFGTIAYHNQSNTYVDLLGFDGRNGALNSQDKDASPVILFQGRNAGTTTTSLLLTAKDAGGALNGMDATQIAYNPNVTPAAGTAWINGDDLLIGGKGDDVIKAGTGDDRIIMSAGKDTVDGGGDIAAVANVSYGEKFTDVLQAEEGTFGVGTNFTVTLDGTIDAKGAGTVEAFDAAAKSLGVTTFTNIETVRALENNRTSSLNLKALSDNIATAVGNDSLTTEGLNILLTKAGGNNYVIDSNNNGVLEATDTRQLTNVFGTENITTGNANDSVTLDQTQANASNKIDLGAQQDNTVLATLREGADTVIYDHSDINNSGAADAADTPLRPTLAVAVTAAGASTVAASAGILGTATSTDTLTGVEIVNLTNAATSDRFNDSLNLSGLAGGVTFNYGAAEAVGKSLGGGITTVTTVAQLDGNTLDAGGIALSATLGTELQTIVGATLLEVVTGSAGDDRIILNNNMQVSGAVTGRLATAILPVQSSLNYNTTTGALAANTDATGTKVADQGLYQFNLGAGANDILDYKQETGGVTVIVDASAKDTDTVLVDARADLATGVERYFGGSGVNKIDLVALTTPTTIQFSKESAIPVNTPANEFAEPAGNNTTTTTGLTRGIEVRNSTDGTVYSRFMDRTGAGIVAQSLWTQVVGSDAAETVIFTDNESAQAHRLDLRGGANRVDYSALTSPIGNAQIGSTDASLASLLQTTNITTAGVDIITNTRGTSPATNVLTLIGSSRPNDTVSALLLDADTFGSAAGANQRAVTTFGNTVASTSYVDPKINVIDLTAGTVSEAVYGQYIPVGSTSLAPSAANFLTSISNFENATNATGTDRVQLLGDGGRNVLTGGNAAAPVVVTTAAATTVTTATATAVVGVFADVIYGGRGTSGDGSSVLGAGNHGDLLTGGTVGGPDMFLYKSETESPGGAATGVTTGLLSATVFGAGATGDINVQNSRDTITDFQITVDKLAFAISDTADAVKVTGTVPASLAGTLNSFLPVSGLAFSTTETSINIPLNSLAAVVADQVDNYTIEFTPALAAAQTIGDLMLRVQASTGANVIDAAAGLSPATALNAASVDGLRVDIVYTAAAQSQGAAFDQIIHFTPATDKIDLSFLKVGRYESSKAGNGVNYDTNNNNVVDALEYNAVTAGLNSVRALPAAPVFAVNSPANGMFLDNVSGTNIYKPVAMQTSGTAGNESTALFIDVNGDANYDPAVDMVVVLVGVGGAVAAPTFNSFIFEQYGGVFGA